MNDVLTERYGRTGMLKLTMLAVLVLPSYMVIGTIGASGSAAQLLAMGLFLLWGASSLFGLHDPLPFGHPGRAATLIWVLASTASYAAMFAGFSGSTDIAGRAAADRWLLLVMAGAGITFFTTESIRTIGVLKSVVRWVMAGSAFCSLVALIQFVLEINPMIWIGSMMAGFQDNGSGNAFQSRDTFMRVSGTTMHPIELAVVSSMLLPLAIWWGLFDDKARPWMRFGVPVMLFAANVITVSRTGMLGLAVSAVIFIPYLPKLAKQWSVVVMPAGAAILFLTVPGMIGTLFSSATAGSTDSSITFRTDDYPLAWQLFFARPFFGLGPGSWMPENMKNIFDNQYLLTVTTMGGVGLVALLVYLLAPFFAALTAAHHATNQETRTLGGAIAAAMVVAAVSAGTFDAMSFQTFALICPFFIGLGGVLWHSVKEQRARPTGASLPPPVHN